MGVMGGLLGFKGARRGVFSPFSRAATLPLPFSCSAPLVRGGRPQAWVALPDTGYASSSGSVTLPRGQSPPRCRPRRSRKSGAYAPPALRKSRSGMPSVLALSARLSVMPDPGKTMRPMGRTSSSWSLRLNGADLP